VSRRACILLASLAACAESPPVRPATPPGTDPDARHSPGARWMERGNWVIEWSSYTPKDVLVDGKPSTVYVPTPGASQHVRDADAPSKVDGGAKAIPKIGMAAADLEPGIIELDVGTVTERNVLQDGLEALAVGGTSARVYWTWRRRAVRLDNGSAVEIPFSTLLVEGVSPGKTELFLHWPNSVKQSVVVNVKAKTPR